MKVLARVLIAACLIALLAVGGVWAYAGVYGLNVVFWNGGTYWLTVRTDSALLSPSMRLALNSDAPAAAGEFHWHAIAEGFEVGDLPVVAYGSTVDHIMLARIDPDRFRFVVRNSPAGDKNLDQWMAKLGAALVVNGSYFARDGRPDTPVLSDGVLIGPKDYDARAGAFIAAPAFAGVRNLAGQNWQAAFQDAEQAMVSFPLLVADGSSHVATTSRWLANRSFVGQDETGRIIIGTTTDAYFSLQRLANFLLQAPLGLTTALNLDGGPVACQGISLNGYERKTYGRWEAQVSGDQVHLLSWLYGAVYMPIVLAVFPK